MIRRLSLLVVFAASMARVGPCTSAWASTSDVLPKPQPITKLKPLYPRTVLVQNGKPAAIVVVPDDDQHATVAEKLRQTIQTATSASLPIVRATQFVDEDWHIDFKAIAGRNMIALGNVNSNRLLSVLYGERYVVADSIYPGKGGHVVRTIHDPFAKGVNVLALLGSDSTGVEQAISVFREKFMSVKERAIAIEHPVIDVIFEKKAYPFFPEVSHYLTSKRQPQYTGMVWFKEQLQKQGFMDEKGKVVTCKDKKTLVSLLAMIGRIGQTYFRRGDQELPPLMKELLDKNRHLLKSPAKVHDMGGRSAYAVPQWDLLEELPIWTDRDRLDITNALLRDGALGHEPRAFHRQVKMGAVQALDENHGTCSARNSLHAWHYFHKYYPSDASDYWMRCARAVFSAQTSTHQILEDACGYLCYCPVHSMGYALKTGDLTYFKRGVALSYARHIAIACMNNLGMPTGYGDSSGVVQPAFFEALAPAAWFYRDARLYWVIRHALPQACGLRIFQNSIAFDLEVEPRVPDEWTGLIHIPVYHAPLAKGEWTETPVFASQEETYPGLFNKIVFKENWDPEGQYLLLDGAGVWGGPPGPHGHKHNDINAIINFTSHGRMWLVDHTYQVRGIQDHSALYVTCEGRGGYRKRTLAKLKNLFETDDYGLSRSTFVNTDRAIFWKKGRFFVLVDQAVADKDGEYFARSNLRALGTAEVRDGTFWLSQGDRFCKIVPDGRANLDLERYEYGNADQWATFYPHAEPVVKIFQQDKSRQLKEGESIGFVNLLYAYADEQEQDAVQMASVSETCALVTDRDQPALIGVGAAPEYLGTADMFVVSEDSLIVLNTTSFLRKLVSTDVPCDLCLDFAGERVKIGCRGPVRLRLQGRVESATEGDEDFALARATDDTLLTFTRGDHTVQLLGWDGLERGQAAVRDAIAAVQQRVKKSQKRATRQRKPEVKGLAVETVALEGQINRLIVADIDGKDDEWIVAGDRGVAAYRQDGKKVWAFETPEPVRSLDVADLNGDGRADIVAGCDDRHLYALDAQGQKKWEFVAKESQGSIDGPARVDYVRITDLEGDGKQEVVVGANWLHVFDSEGELKWEKYMALRRGRICGDFVCGHVDDLDGDGKQEIVALFMTSYPLLQVFDPNGKKIPPASEGGHGGLNIDVPISVATMSLFAADPIKQIVYCGKSRLGFLWHDHKYKEQAGGKVGGSFVAMTHFQPDPAQPPILIGANTICGVVGVKPRPKRNDRWITADQVWYKGLGEKISALLAADANGDGQGEVYVGTKQGTIQVLSVADGEPLAFARLNKGSVTTFTHDPQRQRMLVGMDDGRILCLSRPREGSKKGQTR